MEVRYAVLVRLTLSRASRKPSRSWKQPSTTAQASVFDRRLRRRCRFSCQQSAHTAGGDRALHGRLCRAEVSGVARRARRRAGRVRAPARGWWILAAQNQAPPLAFHKINHHNEVLCQHAEACTRIFLLRTDFRVRRSALRRVTRGRGRWKMDTRHDAARCGRGDERRAHESGHIHTGIPRASGDVKVCMVTGWTRRQHRTGATPRRVCSQLEGVDLQSSPRG